MKIVSTKKIDTADLAHLAVAPIDLKAKRQLREPLLKAFDIYKTNVGYGVVPETEGEKETILHWYRRLCDLEEDALLVVPPPVAMYIKEVGV